MLLNFKRWLTRKLFLWVGALTASIPAVDMALGGLGLDELYGFAVAGLVSWIVKIGAHTHA
jgi:hypothetical protein